VSVLSSLPTLTDALRKCRPNSKLGVSGTSRLDAKTAKATKTASAWELCKAKVFKDAEGKCRACTVRLVRTMTLMKKRYECHHLRPRNLLSAAERVDPACCCALCKGCHEDLKGTPPKLRQIGTTAAAVRFERVK
jgi:hypothetical protein